MEEINKNIPNEKDTTRFTRLDINDCFIVKVWFSTALKMINFSSLILFDKKKINTQGQLLLKGKGGRNSHS